MAADDLVLLERKSAMYLTQEELGGDVVQQALELEMVVDLT